MHPNRGGANEQSAVNPQAKSTSEGNAKAKVTASEYIARGLAAHEATLREMTAKIERLSDRTMSAATKAVFRAILQTIGTILRRVVTSASAFSWSQLGCIAAFLYNVIPQLLPHARNRLLVAMAHAVRNVPFISALLRAVHEIFVLARGLGRTALASIVVVLGHVGINFERFGHVLAKLAQLFSFFVHRTSTVASSTAGPVDTAALMEQVERSFLGQGNIVAMVGDSSMNVSVESRAYELGTLLHENFISPGLRLLHAQWASTRRQPSPYVVRMDASTVDSHFYSVCSNGQLGKAPWLRNAFADPCNIMFTVVQGDNWLAGLLVRPSVGTTDTTYVVASYTHPKARCQGMQRMLIGMVERELRPLRLVRQANATTADDRVQLNIKLGFAPQEWATAFVRSDTARGVMPSLLCEDGGDCVAMGKVVHQHSASDEDVSVHDGHALDSDDGNSSPPASPLQWDTEMAQVQRLNASLWDALGYSPTPSQLRMYATSADVANYDAVVLVLDTLESASVQMHTAVTVDSNAQDCVTWISPRVRGLRQYMEALLERRQLVHDNTLEHARDAYSSETMARFALLGYPPMSASSMHSYLIVRAAVSEVYPTREHFVQFDCGGTRSQCERRCGCVNMALRDACNKHESTIAQFLADRRGSHAYVAAYNEFLRTGAAFQSHLLQPATPALLSHHNGVGFSPYATPVVMPIDTALPVPNMLGRVGQKVVAIASQMPDNVALGDDGATVDCCCTDIGRLPNTFDGSQSGTLAIGDSESTLRCEGTWLHALTRIGSDGTEEDGVFEMNYTPNGIAHIFSECLEVNRRGTTITWSPRSSRCYQLASGRSLPLQMSSNGLGWIIIKPIENQQRQHDAMVASSKHNPRLVAVLIAQLSPNTSMAPTEPVPIDVFTDAAISAVDSDNGTLAILARAAEFGVTGMHQSTVMAVLAARVRAHVPRVTDDGSNPCGANAVLVASCRDAPLLNLDHDFLCHMDCPDMLRVVLNVHAGVSMSGAPKLTQYELLRRTHALLAHAPIDVCVATIEQAFSIKIPMAVIERFKREGCGICDSMKMRRRTFRHNLTDHTSVPIGKKWEFDSIKLRVPSAFKGYVYITRFSNIIDGGRGKKRSYGHLLLDSESIEHCLQKLRAFVRPVHGEIWIYRRDGLPAQQSHRIEDYWTDCDPSPLDQTSPPYVHEGVGTTENSWQWDVPAANCLLRASKSTEPHFYTAFLDAERSSNALVPPGGKSRDEVYYGSKQQPLLTMGLVYGSPVKFLTHPEIRDSKFSEHAQPGIYRGGSRDDESLHRALVQVGTGAAMRHTTVDIGCMRIDERGVIARSDRNHVDHQPFALDPIGGDVEPNFSRWHNPNIDSSDLLNVWTASSALPTKPTIVVFGAGADRAEDSKYWTNNLSTGAIECIRLDKHIGGYEHDWTVPSVNEAMCKLVASPKVTDVFFCSDCAAFSALRCLDNGGPAPMFDSDHPGGIPNPDGSLPPHTVAAKQDIESLITILRAAAIHGKDMLGESPPSRGAGSPVAFKEPHYQKHISVWQYPQMAQFLREFGFTSVLADQGAVGAATMKTTEFKASSKLLAIARQELGTLVSSKRNTESTTLVAGDSGDYTRSRASATYTSALWKRIVKVLLGSRVAPKPVEAALDEDDEQPAPLPISLTREPRNRAPVDKYEPVDARYNAKRLVTVTYATGDGQQAYSEIGASIVAAHTLAASTALLEVEAADMHCTSDIAAVATLHADLRARTHPADSAKENTHPAPRDASATVIAAAIAAASQPRTVLRETKLVEVPIPLVDIATQSVVSAMGIVAVSKDHATVVSLDVNEAHTWHTPKNEKEYLRSPQKALWRTSKELKMDKYRLLKMYRLINVSDVPAGYRIYSTLWAYRIKFDERGKFEKLNPRWCLMGGTMDRNLYDAFSDVVRWSTVILIFNLGARYNLVDFQFDISDAFQSSRTDTPDMGNFPRLFSWQAPGFEERGPNGEKLCCEQLVGMQGRIDAAAIFGTKFGRTLLKRIGCRRLTWDPKAFVFHNGPLANSAANLESILAACATSEIPAAAGAPPGWAFFGMHVDDGIGVASSDALVSYLQREIAAEWIVTFTRWKKCLGFSTSLCDNVVTVSADSSVRQLAREHLVNTDVRLHNMPYTKAILEIGPGVRPQEASPERVEFDLMQTKCRSLLGWGLWAMRVHINLIYPYTICCGFMSNPSYEVYKNAQRALAFELTHPCPLIIGGGVKQPLVLTAAPEKPLEVADATGFLAFVDSNVGAPRTDLETPISEGSMGGNLSSAKAMTGGAMMLGAAPFEIVCGRQHLVAPDSHTGEVTAAGTVVSRIIAHRGLFQEIGLDMSIPTPVYGDSASCLFVANNGPSAIKRSVWNIRRAMVLREAVDMGEAQFLKIPESDNVADGFTKPLKHITWVRHMAYLAPQYNPATVRRINFKDLSIEDKL